MKCVCVIQHQCVIGVPVHQRVAAARINRTDQALSRMFESVKVPSLFPRADAVCVLQRSDETSCWARPDRALVADLLTLAEVSLSNSSPELGSGCDDDDDDLIIFNYLLLAD